MKNEDMPAHPSGRIFKGETKREKAFWQVYSALLSSPNTTSVNEGDIASVAMTLVDEGFKALNKNDK